jgi:hypothetical protein
LHAGPTLIKKKLKSEKELKNAQSLVFGFSVCPPAPPSSRKNSKEHLTCMMCHAMQVPVDMLVRSKRFAQKDLMKVGPVGKLKNQKPNFVRFWGFC